MHIKISSLVFLIIIQLNCISSDNKSLDNITLGFESNHEIDSITIENSGELFLDSVYSGYASYKLQDLGDFTTIKTSILPLSMYKISFWKIGDVSLQVLLNDGVNKLKLFEEKANKKLRGWQKIELLINTSWSDSLVNLEIKIISKKGTVLIDEFQLERIPKIEADYIITLKPENKDKVIKYRNNASASPYIKSKFKKKVKAKLNGKSARIKLKGDWKDHLNTCIWSFKTYIQDSNELGLKTFTFQNLKTRNFLKEWVFIQLCKQAGIVTPNYNVVNVSINNGASYVCAQEEDFSNDFIRRKRGYSAPVLRLYEDFLFPHWVYGWGRENAQIPEIKHSYIYSYESDKYKEGGNYILFKEHAQKLKLFIKSDSVIHLIDKNKWATFFAIQSLTKSFHNLTWHNTRWFVNEKGLIEPIAYDGNTQGGETENWFGGGIYGDLDNYLNSGSSVAVNFTNKLFMDEGFMKVYKKKLELYSSKTFLTNQIKMFSVELEKCLNKVKVFYDYEYSSDYLFITAEKIRKRLPSFENENWKGKEGLFKKDFSKGITPLTKMYISNLIRGYIEGDSINIVNGVSHEVTLMNKLNDEVIVLKPNSDISIIKNDVKEWFVSFEGNKIIIDLIPWIPLHK